MAQLKRYNGTSWENVGGSVAPKTSQTTSDTDTYSCNYVNNNLTNIKSAIDYKNPDYMGDVVVESIRSKNLFNPYIQSGTYSSGVTYTVASDGKITQSASDGALWTDATAKSFLLPAGTYTFSINGKGSSNTFQVYNYNTSSSIHESTASTFTYTFNETTRLGIKTYGGGYPQNYYIQIEEGTSATTYSPYQNLNGYDNYSTGEQRIGTFLGQPLYRKVAIINSIDSSGNSKQISVATNNLKEFVNITGMVANNSGGYKPLNSLYISGSGIDAQYTFQIYAVNNLVIEAVYGNWWKTNFKKAYVILEYTKTTD